MGPKKGLEIHTPLTKKNVLQQSLACIFIVFNSSFPDYCSLLWQDTLNLIVLLCERVPSHFQQLLHHTWH